jgi:hypothetical protein
MRAGPFLSQCQTLKYTEAVLFVNNGQIQFPKTNAFLNKGMGTYK